MLPERGQRAALRSGDRAAVGCFDRATVLLGRRHPAAGSHLPPEDTASPYAVAPFASSPFAHPIPQSTRHAHVDLSRDSLTVRCRRTHFRRLRT